jgi:6-pyruvoyltetrahydropterin/6-carboxytetrahydropterin synthase
MKAYLTRRYRFCAAHRLHSEAMSEAENLATYGKCNNPHGHGHNYLLEVTVGGQVDGQTGMVCNLVELDDVVGREILSRYDHENLNTLPDFSGKVTTSEVLAEQIFNILRREFHAAHLERVKLEETSLNSFEYTGGAEMR